MEIVLAVFCGFVLDLIFGDPQHIPHPISCLLYTSGNSHEVTKKAAKVVRDIIERKAY